MSDLASGIAASPSTLKLSTKDAVKEMQPIGAQPEKKGKRSWKPHSLLDVYDKQSGYRYRWVNKEPQNVYKKKAEGWEMVSGITSDTAKQPEHVKRMMDGANITSIIEKHDCVLMRLPEELATERDDYFRNQTARRTQGITDHIHKEAAKQGTETHGEITISSRHGIDKVE